MEKINLTELLRDCPKGMELDCMMFQDVYFDYVDELNIIHCYIQHETHKESIVFNQHGTYNSDIKSKCVIFPKGKTTWKGFVPPCKFKNGDVLFVDCSDDNDKSYQYIFILNKIYNGKVHSHCHYRMCDVFHPKTAYLTDDVFPIRFATEEEKEKLFDAIKTNGYKWNPGTQKLEEMPGFKNGDVIYNKDINALAIFYKQTDASTISHCFFNVLGELRIHHYHSKDLSDWNFATEEEKEKLFKVIKDKGYHWNDETKTLEKLIKPKPYFKIGDKIRPKNNKNRIRIIDYIYSDSYALLDGHLLYFSEQDQYELVSNKFKVGDRVKHISAHTSASGVVLKVGDKGYYIDLPKNGGVRYISFTLEKDYELVPNKFDINTLVPFEDKVLVRNSENQKWVPAFWGYKVADGFVTTFGWCKYCIPYNGNEILFKTNNDCDDYFKTWQE